ncbi:MAG: glycoside hydrolase family 3 protein [Saccharospirillum sp.]|nr:glycoside hydrolase family 3 protein [Saccharospirillum sp.]
MSSMPYFDHWPVIQSAIPHSDEVEAFVESILSQMTLEEKVGQMIQPDIRDVTPEEAGQYKLGSVLNGGGAWVDDNKQASSQQWVALLDQFWEALESAYADRPFRVPYLWGTDAVHGHNNIYRATVFPHNIGLGAANDVDLIHRIARATAMEICVTGMDWTFAPTVATPRNLRWGRTYEGYSEDPEIVYRYAPAVVAGLQGNAETLRSDQKVLSNVKHWVGDGGTLQGTDRGRNEYSEELLRNLHAAGYISGLEAGAQIVMASFSTWENAANYDHSPVIGEVYNNKLTGSRYLITDVLKQQMGFDGFVISDWNAHAEVSRCSLNDANYAINAGIDVIMATGSSDWREVYRNILQGVRTHAIAQARIDDAVRRILRVKVRAGLWQKPKPSQRSLAGRDELLGCAEHRALAREAVRKSLVLLKNRNALLPLSRNSRVLITGSACNDMQKQTGGWTLTWQGNENSRKDFPGAETLAEAIQGVVGPDKTVVDPNPELASIREAEVAIVVIGEDPYAEMFGDIKAGHSLAYSRIKRKYGEDLTLLKRLHDSGIPIVTVLYSGRPLYVNEEMNLSDAFIAAWLPGTEARGMTDLLFQAGDGEVQHDFSGRLSYSWPNRPDSDAVNQLARSIPDYQCPACEQHPEGEHRPLFGIGYGLSFAEAQSGPDVLPLFEESDTSRNRPDSPWVLFGQSAEGDCSLLVSTEPDTPGTPVSSNSPTALPGLLIKPCDYLLQQDARSLAFSESGRTLELSILSDDGTLDWSGHALKGAQLCISLRFYSAIPDDLTLLVRGPTGVIGQRPLADCLQTRADPEWQQIRLPLLDLQANSHVFGEVVVPFSLTTTTACRFDLGQVSLVMA